MPVTSTTRVCAGACEPVRALLGLERDAFADLERARCEPRAALRGRTVMSAA
jgi:hypothetical protein